MWKLSNKLRLLVLMLSLMGLVLCWPNIAESAREEIEYTGTGYLLSEQAGRNILEGWLFDRVAKEQYKTALDNTYAEWQQTKLSLREQITEIRKSHTQEQQEWRRIIRKSRVPGFGIFAGPGYTSERGVQLVIGVGLVWKFF